MTHLKPPLPLCCDLYIIEEKHSEKCLESEDRMEWLEDIEAPLVCRSLNVLYVPPLLLSSVVKLTPELYSTLISVLTLWVRGPNAFSDAAFYPIFQFPEHYAIAHPVHDSNQVPENQIFSPRQWCLSSHLSSLFSPHCSCSESCQGYNILRYWSFNTQLHFAYWHSWPHAGKTYWHIGKWIGICDHMLVKYTVCFFTDCCYII